MKQVTITLYEFDELSEQAKEKAREWWRQGEAEFFGRHGDIYEAYETAAKMIGIEFARRDVPLMGGGKRSEPCIWWLLHVQGCGASFAGQYSYQADSVKAVTEEFPEDKELHRIARELETLQAKYSNTIEVKITTSGREVHKFSMEEEVTALDGVDLADGDDQAVRDLMGEYADWIYNGIKEEYEAHMEDEYVDDAIRANEYTFRVDGRRSDD